MFVDARAFFVKARRNASSVEFTQPRVAIDRDSSHTPYSSTTVMLAVIQRAKKVEDATSSKDEQLAGMEGSRNRFFCGCMKGLGWTCLWGILCRGRRGRGSWLY